MKRQPAHSGRVRWAALVLVLVAATGCLREDGAPEASTCSHAPATAATALELWPCARDAAEAWRAGAVLVGAEAYVGTTEGELDPSEYRSLDGNAPRWQFTFADLDARVSRMMTLAANGTVVATRDHAWEEGARPKPHADGYEAPLPEAYLDSARFRGLLLEDATARKYVAPEMWRAYSLVSVEDKLPAWFIASGGGERQLLAQIDPSEWRIVFSREANT